MDIIEHDKDEQERCPTCGASPQEPCRRGPGSTGDGHTSCGDGLSNIAESVTHA